MYKITKLFKNRYFKILFVFVFSFLVTFYTFLDVREETSNAVVPVVATAAVAPAVVDALVVALIAMGVTYVSYELVEYTMQELNDEMEQSATSFLVARLQEDFVKQKEEEEQSGGDGNGKKKFEFGGKDLLDLAQAMYDILNEDTTSDGVADDIKCDFATSFSYGDSTFGVYNPGYYKYNLVAVMPFPNFYDNSDSPYDIYKSSFTVAPTTSDIGSIDKQYELEYCYAMRDHGTTGNIWDKAYWTFPRVSHYLIIYTMGRGSWYTVNSMVCPSSEYSWTSVPSGAYTGSGNQPHYVINDSNAHNVSFNISLKNSSGVSSSGVITGSTTKKSVTIPRSTLGDTTNISVPPSMQDGVTVVIPPNPTKDLGLPSVANVDSSSPPLTISQTGATLQDSKNRDINVSTLETGTTESGILNSILSFFGNFFGKLADLFGLLLKSLFIPSDTYFSNYFDDIKNAFSVKLKADDYIKIFQPDFGNKKIDNIKVNFFGTECTIVNFDYFYQNKPSFDKWARGVFYALLGIYNYSQIYRLIRGTAYSSVGKEEGGKKK